MGITAVGEKLAIHGGSKTVTSDPGDIFKWPIVTEEDEQAVLGVLRAGKMSGTDVTREFEAEYAAYQGTEFALAHCNGTAAVLGAMYGCGVGRGDEIIAPSLTYWATALPAFNLGATVVFADIEADSLCLDPNDIEHRITPRTKAIVPVHYCGHPADLDPIMEIARNHGVKVIEDVSHAHGCIYKGKMTGAIGDVGAMSMMAGKSFAIGEAGMIVTDDREILERAMAFGHYERSSEITLPELVPFKGLPLGGFKHRINQTCSAMGRVQLKSYPERVDEIQRAMNYFWDQLEGVPGLRAHRPAADSGSTMGGWYNPVGHYLPEELGGLSKADFIKAVSAEGRSIGGGCNFPMHLHPVLNDADIYNDGKPTRIAFSENDLREGEGTLPVSEALAGRCIGIPWFKKFQPEIIEQHAAAFRKVAENADQLL